MNDQTEAQEVENKPQLPALEIEDITTVSRYLTRHSIPRDLTVAEVQEVMDAFNRFLNASIQSQVILRNIAGVEPLDLKPLEDL